MSSPRFLPSPRASASQVQGRAQGPLRARCEVLSYGRIGAYHSLTFVSPEIADRARPGQFVTIGVEGAGTVLRRPFSIYNVSRHGPWAGTVQIVFDIVGEGTRWLTTRMKHDSSTWSARWATVPDAQAARHCLLVGGGYGAAPLLYLAQELQQDGPRGHGDGRPRPRTGSSTRSRPSDFRHDALFTTEDGSVRHEGPRHRRMDKVMDAGHIGLLYACGPMPMLRGGLRVAERRGVPVHVAVEEPWPAASASA